MRDQRDISKRPVITERSKEMIGENKYTFAMDVKSKKAEVTDALEAKIAVRVETVNLLNYYTKVKPLSHSGGCPSSRWKTISKLPANNKEIEMFQGVKFLLKK
ncbi:50S ribosomal protein L23, partial [Bacillus sp. S1-R5C1-FB]|uniref:50S ribosomal protein L23 n=1 Tax=Bacillus sp. S1-R5C1-FB TaxID=1973491 RepID=UPI000B490F81